MAEPVIWKLPLPEVRVEDVLRAEGNDGRHPNLMLPRKSVSMVMGVGHDLPGHKGQTHCDFCTLQGNCPMNKVIGILKEEDNL